VRILSYRVVGHRLLLKVRTLGAGRITVKGKGLRTGSRRVGKSATVTFKLALTRGGLRALRRHHRLKVGVRISFQPARTGGFISAAFATVRFK
jgi:hypothetical protein